MLMTRDPLNNLPQVSVIIPCFNRESTITRAINSVLKQDYPNVEIIVVDDGSTDKTVERIRETYSRNKEIHIFCEEENRGVSHARNVGIENSTGKYISFLDSDDEWNEHHLQEAVRALETTGYNIFMAMWEIEQNGKIHGIETTDDGDVYFNDVVKQLKAKVNGSYYLFNEGIYELSVLELFYFFHINTLVIQRELVNVYGGFNEQFQTSEDTEFILRLLRNEKKIAFSKKYHFVYHMSSDGIYSFISSLEIGTNNIRQQTEGIKKKILEISQQKVNVRRQCKDCVKTVPVAFYEEKEYLKLVDDYISKKFVYMAYICSVNMKLRCIHYALLALKYCHSQSEKKFIVKMIRGIIFKNKLEEQDYLPHMNYW